MWRSQAPENDIDSSAVPYGVSQKEKAQAYARSLQDDQLLSGVFIEHSLGFMPVRSYSNDIFIHSLQ